MTDILDRVIYGKSSNHDHVAALSAALTAEDAAAWRPLVTLAPPSESSGSASKAVGVFPGPGHNFLLAAADQDGDEARIEIVLIPRKLLLQAAGNLDPLLSLVMQPAGIEVYDPKATLPPLDTPALLPWQFDDRVACFHALLHEHADGRIDDVLRLLGATLDERRLLVCGFAPETRTRLLLVEGLMALLPANARAELTFSTCADEAPASGARVIFADAVHDTERHSYDAASHSFPDSPDLLEIPYIGLLRDLWQDDESSFLRQLEELEPIADALLPGQELLAGLNQLAGQTRFNEQVRRGEAVDPEALKSVLGSNIPLSPDLEERYGERLLDHALEARDSEAALVVALKMDEDPALDAALNDVLIASLDTQPDAVYFFVRTRLNDAMEADSRWINRLHTAALVSLRVAISDADGETIMNWLRLIAREPASYGLAEILREGILATQARARADGDLARYLITLAIKHTPDILDTLLADPALLAILPNNLGLVLRDHAGDPLYTLQNRGPELFLVATARSARAQAASPFTPEVIDQIWRLYTAGQTFSLPEHYLPETVIDMLAQAGPDWLPPEILEHLATLILADGRDKLFMTFAAHLAEQEQLIPLLGSALQDSQRSLDDVITLVSQLAAAGQIDQQATVDVYVMLLQEREWRQTTLPLVEQLARLIQQHPTLNIEPDMIWRLLDVAMAARSEMVARVGAQQLFNDIEQVDAAGNNGETDAQLTESLLRLYESLQWSTQARNYVMKWWRDFVHRQPLARLIRLDKAMESKKTLNDCRAVVQTSLAFRRMLGTRTMAEFADVINLIFSLLEAISESFDPSPRQPTSFDEETIRSELDARRGDITDHQWRILAKNFKELASLIGVMGDHRSRGSLVRQNVDRQLLAGMQQPESAVDAMKWIAGYLEGVQDRGSDESE
ncbi:MAG: hypothetical protein K8J31_18935 [Anaerolineae bacterium]|nr:hypothetical protein [Anaerolineae bacterium]